MNQEDYNFDFQDFFANRLRERGISLEKLSKVSGISQKHLEGLLRGDLEHLPAAPYLHGYITKLGNILEFDGEAWWTHMKKESGIKRSGATDELPKNRFAAQNKKTIWIVASLVILLMLIGARLPRILGEPTLTISTPSSLVSNTKENSATIKGRMINGNSLYINEELTETGADGEFEKIISLEPGLNTITITAKKTLGRETTSQFQIFYEEPFTPPSLPSSAQPTPPQSPSTTPAF